MHGRDDGECVEDWRKERSSLKLIFGSQRFHLFFPQIHEARSLAKCKRVVRLSCSAPMAVTQGRARTYLHRNLFFHLQWKIRFSAWFPGTQLLRCLMGDRMLLLVIGCSEEGFR